MIQTPRTRYGEINAILFKQVQNLYRLRRNTYEKSEEKITVSYVVTIGKRTEIPFEERAASFYRILLSALRQDEQLLCVDRCFKIVGPWYILIYCFEGYKKNADKIGYMENGVPCSCLIRRMGYERSFKELRHLSRSQIENANRRMYADEMKRLYPNPADRWVAAINDEKRSGRYAKLTRKEI